MKRSFIRSLPATAAVTFMLLVAAATASAEFFPLNPCSQAPVPPGGTCQPGGITTGPDGNIWFTQENGNRIGRVNPGGSITDFPLSAGSQPVEIAAAGGRLWFTQLGRNKIGAMDPGSGAVTEYPSGSNLDAPADGITLGPDGALWFTEFSTGGTSRIGRMTTDGSLTNEFVLSSSSEPGDIASGPPGDNRVWFTQANGRIGAIPVTASSGSDVSHYPPTGGLNDPAGITASGTGLWFTEPAANQIRRIEITGALGLPIPVGAGPSAIATGADGALWFTEEAAGKIGRITPSGTLSEFPTSSFGSQPGGITAGPDGALWFTEFIGNNIGRIATAPPFVPPPPPGSSTPPPAAKKKSKRCKVPRLRGLTVKKARKRLRKAKCKYKIRGKGRVRSTNPKAGRTTTKRVTVKCGKKTRRR